MRRLFVALSASVAIAATPAAAAAASPASALPVTAPAGIGLSVVAQQTEATLDEGMPLRVTVTNRGTAPCAIVANPDGGVRVVAVTRDGQPVPSTTGNRAYLDGYESALRSDVRTLEPGKSASFTVRLGTGRPLTAATPRSESSALIDRWLVDRPGTYRVELAYAPPALTGTTPCAGPSASAVAEFALGTGGIPVVWYIAGAVLLLALGVLIWWLVQRRKTPRTPTSPKNPTSPATAAVLIAVVVAGLLAGTPGAARADITAPPPASPAFMAAVNACLVQLRTYDPAGLLAYFDGPGAPPVDIRPAARWQDTWTDGEAGNPSADVSISWNPDRTGAFDSGTAYEPCPALEHELSHAYDYAHGADGDNEKWCDSTGVSLAQVRAMLIENQIRAKGGEPPHAYDGLNKIPTSLDQCAAPPPPGSRSPLVYPSCLGPGGPGVDSGGCAATDGDPHLTTFDGRRYDLQSAGEFVAVRGPDIEMQVRQQPVPGSHSVAVSTAIAVRASINRIGFYLVGGLLVVHRGGAVVDPASGDTALDDGVVLTRRPGDVPGNGDGYTISGPDGSMLYVDRIGTWGLVARVKLAAVRGGTVSGLLGDFDGDPTDDLVTADGTKLPDPPPADQVRGAFADAWRVTAATSLFDYAAGQSTATFTDRAFPDPAAAGPDPAATAHAKAVCAAAGITDPTSLAACVLDVAETGASEFASAAAATQRTMTVPKPTTVAVVLRDGGAVSGKIDDINGSRRYPMDLGDARAFYVVDWDGPGACDQSFSVNVVGVSNGNFPCDKAVMRFDVPTAHPVLEVASAFGRTGAYSFRIVTEKVKALALRAGQTVNGDLDAPGRVDVYTFDGVASVHLIGPPACAHDVRFVIRRADDKALVVGDRTLCGFDGFIPLPDPSVSYTVTVSSPDMVPQTYTLRIA